MEQTTEALDYNEVFQFMKKFGADLLNRYGELIIDEPTNTYVHIRDCKSIEEVKMRVVFALCRPIGKGLDRRSSARLLERVNNYFEVELTKEDMLLMYQKLCYTSKTGRFMDFISDGFPMNQLRD